MLLFLFLITFGHALLVRWGQHWPAASAFLLPRAPGPIPDGATITFGDNNEYQIVFDGAHYCGAEPLEGVISKDGIIENTTGERYLTELQSVTDIERIDMALYGLQLSLDETGDSCSSGQPGRTLLAPRHDGLVTATLLKAASKSIAGGFIVNFAWGVTQNTTSVTTAAIGSAVAVYVNEIVGGAVDSLKKHDKLSASDALIYSIAGTVFQAISKAAVTLQNGQCPTQANLDQAVDALSELEMAELGLANSDQRAAQLDRISSC